MDADFELDADGNVSDIGTHGGRRAGAGGPKGLSREQMQAKANASADNDCELDPTSPDRLTIAVRKAMAVALKEESIAGLKALELQVETKKYLPRDAFREATATLLATLSQALRSIPDTLERKHALSPEALKFVEDTIDKQLSGAAATLALFAGTPE